MAGIRIGVVGLRNRGRAHLRNAREAGVHVAAVADTDPGRLVAVGEEFGIAGRHADAAELFARDDIDAVVLVLPNHLHAPVGIAALRAGKHVLVEKPITGTVADAEALLAARDETGRILMVGMNQRFSPTVYGAREWIASGAIGRIRLVRAHWHRRRLSEGVWGRGDWWLSRGDSGGGPLLDIGLHKVDQALFVAGWPAIESAYGVALRGIGAAVAGARGKVCEVEDALHGVLRLADDAVFQIEASFFSSLHAEESHGIEIEGERGGLRLGAGGDAAWTIDLDGTLTEHPLPTVASAPTSPVAHFSRVISGAEPLAAPAEEALDLMRAFEALYVSADTHRAVEVAPALV